ncbi:MAG: hypothetical protein ACC660_08415 [Acidimicrobiales bacterium]
MTVFTDNAGRWSSMDFVPEGWLADLQAQAAKQVRAVGLHAAPQPRRHSGAGRVFVVSITCVVVAVICAATILWAVGAGSALALWLIGGFWVLSAVSLSTWVGWHADAFVDAAVRW